MVITMVSQAVRMSERPEASQTVSEASGLSDCLRGLVSVWEAWSQSERPGHCLRGLVAVWEAWLLSERPGCCLRGLVIVWEAWLLSERPGHCMRGLVAVWEAWSLSQRHRCEASMILDIRISNQPDIQKFVRYSQFCQIFEYEYLTSWIFIRYSKLIRKHPFFCQMFIRYSK